MKYNFDEVIERRKTDSAKWDNVVNLFGSEDVLPMWVADMDFRIPEPIVEAVVKRAQHPIYGYTLTGSALKSVIDRLYRKYGWKVEPDWIVITPGVVPAVNAAVRAYSGEGGSVIIQSPAYPPFWTSATNNKCVSVANPLIQRGDKYEVDFEDLEAKFAASGAKSMILCNPHNPVGRVFREDELRKMGEIALRHGAVMISDEIHCELVLKGYKHIPFASLSPEFAKNSITCYAASKTFNIAGMHCSVAIIPDEELRKRFNEAKGGMMGTPDFLAIIAMATAFDHGDEWLEQAIDYIQANVDYTREYFAKRIPRIKPVDPEGTYLLWLDCRDLGLDAKALRKFFNEEAKVGLNDGVTFGPGGEGFQRMNLACPRALLEEGLRRIEKAVNAL